MKSLMRNPAGTWRPVPRRNLSLSLTFGTYLTAVFGIGALVACSAPGNDLVSRNLAYTQSSDASTSSASSPFNWSAKSVAASEPTMICGNITYDSSQGWGVYGPKAGSQAIAMECINNGPKRVYITSISFAMAYQQGETNKTYLRIYSNEDGLPDKQLHEKEFVLGSGITQWTFKPCELAMKEDETLWLVADTVGDTIDKWYFTNPVTGGTMAFANTGLKNWSTMQNDVSSFAFYGSPCPSASRIHSHAR